MAIFELFSSSFLFSILIIIVLGLFFSYINYKILDQDHKISSMISLISTMAGEIREAKNIFNSNSEGSSKINMSDTIQFNPQFLGGNSNLIEVSDDDDDDDESDDDDSDDGDDNDSDDGDDNDSDDEGDDSDNEDTDEDGEYYDNGSDIDIDEEIKIDSSDIKVLKIELDTHLDLKEEGEGEAEESYKSIVLNETFDFDNLEENKNELSITSNDLSDLKQIILEPENDETQKKIDYKNLPLHKLKEIVTEKKINVDVKKLKKNEILKILGEE